MSQPHRVFDRLRASFTLERLPWQDVHGVSEYPQAAVLVALTSEQKPRVLLGRRAMHLPIHPGEVAFAGGKRELEDASPWVTATREAQEEVGIDPSLVTGLGELQPMITRTGFEVFPCIAGVPPELDLVVDPAEFDSVLLPPLEAFADATIFRLEEMFDGKRYRKVPHFQLGEDNVWGVTATILALLVNVAYDAGFELQRDWNKKP